MDSVSARRRHRAWSVWLPIVLVVAYFGGRAWVRSHVDDLIEHAVGKPLPEFVLRDAAGRDWSRAALLGKPAVLHFFRSKCGSCDVEAPAMRELEAQLGEAVTMLHVMTDEVLGFDPALTRATLGGKAFARPVLMADAAFVDAFHSVTWSNVTPITYVVDAQGVVRYGLRGMQTVASVQKALAAVR